MSEADTPTNLAFIELANSINLTQADQVNSSSSDSPEHKSVPVNLPASQAEKRSTEAMLARKNQELDAALLQVQCLSQELKTSAQTTQRQQILIETLTAKLESSQERLAQIERECALTQQRYNEQSHQLRQTENTCRDLCIRLTRQQRHSLQFKVALEPAEAIQPWSAESESLINAIEPTSDRTLSNDSVEERGQGEKEVEALPLIEEKTKAQELHIYASNTDEAEDSQYQDLVKLLEAVEEPPEAIVEPAVDLHSTAQFEAEEPEVQADNPAEQSESSASTESPQFEITSFTLNSNWPSPVIYPSRPPKGRKSLAAVELPTFPLSQT